MRNATADELAYTIAHGDADLTPNIIIYVSICASAATIFVIVRLIARHMTYKRLRLDLSDWLIIGAWVFTLIFNILLGVVTKYGGAEHVYNIDPRRLQIFTLLAEAAYNPAVGFIKLSILALYGSIFPSRRFHYCLWTVDAFIIAWVFAATFGTIFSVRLAYTLQVDAVNGNWTTIPAGLCSVLELTVGILVASIPIYRVIYRRIVSDPHSMEPAK
ncbi:hypothetical protein F4810DRAFT_716903 [Camillea tinctor]|nr:hypothetical protein F4810DRAFT_716903 [Camillea tinctor]